MSGCTDQLGLQGGGDQSWKSRSLSVEALRASWGRGPWMPWAAPSDSPPYKQGPRGHVQQRTSGGPLWLGQLGTHSLPTQSRFCPEERGFHTPHTCPGGLFLVVNWLSILPGDRRGPADLPEAELEPVLCAGGLHPSSRKQTIHPGGPERRVPLLQTLINPLFLK